MIQWIEKKYHIDLSPDGIDHLKLVGYAWLFIIIVGAPWVCGVLLIAHSVFN